MVKIVTTRHRPELVSEPSRLGSGGTTSFCQVCRAYGWKRCGSWFTAPPTARAIHPRPRHQAMLKAPTTAVAAWINAEGSGTVAENEPFTRVNGIKLPLVRRGPRRCSRFR